MATFGDDALTEGHISFADRPRPFGRGDGSTGGGTGATGPRGPVGPVGPSGVDGNDGAQGVDGDDGSQGVQGLQGQPGNDGIQGIQGLQGLKGDAGPPSPAGLTWKGAWDNATAYVLNDTIGYNGASYFCILAHTGYQPTENVSDTYWALIAAQGAPGTPGVDGDQGIAGATGAQGLQGLAGPDGAQGVDGADGPQGPAGEGAGQMEVVTRATRGTGVSKGEMKWEEDKKAIIIWDGTSWIAYGVPATAPDSDFTPAPGNFFFGQTVIFTDASTDEDGSVVEREWSNNFNSDTGTSSTYEITLPTGVFGNTAQTVQVSLKVTDDSGLTNAQTQDYVLQIAPLVGPDLFGEGVFLNDDGTEILKGPIIYQAEQIFNAGGSNPDEIEHFYSV